VTGEEGTSTGVTSRVYERDRLTWRSERGVEREVHADDGVTVERA